MIRCVLVLAMFASTAARAEEIVAYTAEGQAPVAGADPRVTALDDAFARAVTSALAELLGGDVRVAHKAELDREIVGHARLWVTKFTVTKDETNDDRRQLTVSVRIDRDKIRARLVELNITTPAAPDAVVAPQHTVTILMRLAAPDGVRANFGASADKDAPGIAALTRVFRDAGYAVRRPGSSGAPRDAELPVDDDTAAALAAEAKADRAVIVGIAVGAPVIVRGQAGTAALVTAHVRVVEGKKAIADAIGTAAAPSSTTETREAGANSDPGMLGYAIDRALLAAAADVIPPAPQKLAQAGAFHGEDTPIGEPGVVLVRLPAKTPPSMVWIEQRYLAGARGIRAATLRRVSPAGWVIGVSTGESIDKIAQIVKRPPATDTATTVKIVGDVVELELSGAM